ncbi:MAG: PAS domain-containing protein [Propionibacteriaceae bacterium]|jgi:aerotaxis receptor|nr:PAS domain-containing protein [Propionibacteriaceae bacterium]
MLDESVTWPTMAATRQANGLTHEVGEGQLFFSMTDRRGVITAANSVFVELARFPRAELMGSPHSIIRHPDMPAGVFQLMWDEILDGRPFCCYINNLAADGSTYTVFATITPAPDGFLSVRVRPLRRDLLESALGLYAATRPVELAARAHGINRRGAAAIGYDKFAELLAEAGYESYAEFQWRALVAEADARSAVPAGLQARPRATGPLAAMLMRCQTLTAELGHWSSHQAAIQHMAQSLSDAIPHLLHTATTATTTAATPGDTAGVGDGRHRSAAFLASRLAQLSSIIRDLVKQLVEFRRTCFDTRSQVALARLHTDALSQFVVEIIDDGMAAYDEDAISQICQALDLDFAIIGELSEQTATYAATTVHELARAHGLIADQRSVVQQLTAGVGAAAPAITQQLAALEDALDLIEHLGHAAEAITTPQDTRLAETQVAGLLSIMDTLAD